MIFYKKHEWQKWEHVIFIEEFTGGIPTYEILKRVCNITGLTEYKKIKIGSHSHGLYNKLTHLIGKNT